MTFSASIQPSLHLVDEIFYNLLIIPVQVNRAAVEGYTGEGEPPCIVMTLKTDDISPPDLSLPIIFTGVREPSNTLLIKRPAEGNVVSTSSPCRFSTHLALDT